MPDVIQSLIFGYKGDSEVAHNANYDTGEQLRRGLFEDEEAGIAQGAHECGLQNDWNVVIIVISGGKIP